MVDVIWTAQALDDLSAIAEFIAKDSRQFASLFVIDAMTAAERAGEFPQTGRIVPETAEPSIREALMGNYRIIYRVGTEAVSILTVYHSARLIDIRRLY